MPVIKKQRTKKDVKKIDQVVWQFEALQAGGAGLTLDIAIAVGEEIVNEMVSMIEYNQVRPKSKYVPIIYARGKTGIPRDQKGWPRKTKPTLYETGQFKESLGWAATRFRRKAEGPGKPRQRSAYVVVGAAPEIYKTGVTQGVIDPNNLAKNVYSSGARNERVPLYSGEGKKTNAKIFAIQELGAVAHPKPKKTQYGPNKEKTWESVKGLFGVKRHPPRRLLKKALQRVGIKRVVEETFREDFKEIRRSGRIPLRDTKKRDPNKFIHIYTDEWSIRKIKNLPLPSKKGQIDDSEVIPPGMRDFLGRFSRTAFKFDAKKFQVAALRRTSHEPKIEVNWQRFTGRKTNYVADVAFAFQKAPDQWELGGVELTSYYPGMHISTRMYQIKAAMDEWDSAERIGRNMLNRPVVDLLSVARAGVGSDPERTDRIIRKNYVFSGLESRGSYYIDPQTGEKKTYRTKSQSQYINMMAHRGITDIPDLTGQRVSPDELEELENNALLIENTNKPWTKIHTDIIKLAELTRHKSDLHIVMGFGNDLPAGAVRTPDGKSLTIAKFSDRIIEAKDGTLFLAEPDENGFWPENAVRVTEYLTKHLSIGDRKVEVVTYDPNNIDQLVGLLIQKGYRFDLDKMWQEGLIKDEVKGAPSTAQRAIQRKKKIEKPKVPGEKRIDWEYPAGLAKDPIWEADKRTLFTPKYLYSLDRTVPKKERIENWGIEPGTKFKNLAELEDLLNSRLPRGDSPTGEGWVIEKFEANPREVSRAVIVESLGDKGKITHATFRYTTKKEGMGRAETIDRPLAIRLDVKKRVIKDKTAVQRGKAFSPSRMVKQGLIDREISAEEQVSLLNHLDQMLETGEVWFENFEFLRILEDSEWTSQRLRNYLNYYFGDKAEVDWEAAKFEENFKTLPMGRKGGFKVRPPRKKLPTGELVDQPAIRISAIRIRKKDLKRKENEIRTGERRFSLKYETVSTDPNWRNWYKVNHKYFDQQVENAIRVYKGKPREFQSLAQSLRAASRGSAKFLQMALIMLKAQGIDLTKMDKGFIEIFIAQVSKEI